MNLVLKIDLSRVRIVIAMIHQKHFSNLGKFAALFLSTGIFVEWGEENRKCWKNLLRVNKVVGLFIQRAIEIYIFL